MEELKDLFYHIRNTPCKDCLTRSMCYSKAHNPQPNRYLSAETIYHLYSICPKLLDYSTIFYNSGLNFLKDISSVRAAFNPEETINEILTKHLKI